jgi:hypothetical protein
MRELPFAAELDAVISIFTSFGYFRGSGSDLRTLPGVSKALRPCSCFLLETMHRDSLPARFQPRGFERTAGGSIVLHERGT